MHVLQNEIVIHKHRINNTGGSVQFKWNALIDVMKFNTTPMQAGPTPAQWDFNLYSILLNSESLGYTVGYCILSQSVPKYTSVCLVPQRNDKR